MTHWPWAALLTLVGCGVELIGVLFLADDLAGKGPASWTRWARRRVRPLAARFGLRKPTEYVHLGSAILGLGHVTADMTFTRSADRELPQRVADLETDTRALFDRTAMQQKELRLLQEDVAALPEHLKAEAEKIAQQQLEHRRQEQLPIQKKSFFFVLTGVILNGAGALFALF